MPNDPITLRWRPELLRRGFQAIAVLPIREQNEVRGTLSVYSVEPFFFQDEETALLDEAASNVSFALDNFAREEARRQAERTLRAEKQFTELRKVLRFKRHLEKSRVVLYRTFDDEEGFRAEIDRHLRDTAKADERPSGLSTNT